MEKYFIQNDETGYFVQIYEDGFTGTNTEIFGKLSIDKGSVNNVLDTIRGTGINLQLEANPLLTFEEFSEVEDEKKYTAKVTKGGVTVFNGFLKPDGITQSFTRDYWNITLDFVDGLGSLKDLAFVKSNGLNYTGKMSVYDVILGCLERTGILMTINHNIDVYYLEYSGTNILKDTYVSADRYFKIDAQTTGGGTTMTCEEVLNSLLNLFSACITQQEGYWWIYRPNDIKPNVIFTDNTLNTTFTKNLYKKVGSQIDNYYPHHASGNQTIQTKGAISAYRLNYKYGFIKGLFDNSNLNHDNNLIFDKWTKAPFLNGVELINDPLDTSGLLMKAISGSTLNVPLLTSESKPVLAGSQLDLVVELSIDPTDPPPPFEESVADVLFLFRVERSDGWYANDNGVWVNSFWNLSKFVKSTGGVIVNETWTLKIEPVPSDCTVKVVILEANKQSYPLDVIVEVKSCQINNNFNYDGRVGEFHTVSRLVAPSSIVKENQEVYNGDSIGEVFEGAIYKSDKTTLTTIWTRDGFVENKPLLRISAEDDLRIQQKPIKEFSGSFYGYLPYLSIIEINNISGLFMFTEYSYDTDSNITNGKLLQYYTNEVADLQYALTFDFGETVKPSIKG